MATFRYFTTCPTTSATVSLRNVNHDNGTFKGTCPDCGASHVCQRKIERKSSPSNHKCDVRCLTATGFKCECSCGGKNHGAQA